MATLTFRGEPYVVDVLLRPILSAGRWVVGALLGALLFWLQWWWWVPVPLVLATALIEAYLVLRSDRPVTLTFDDAKVVVDDRFAATLTVFRDRIHAVTVLTRERPSGAEDGHEVVTVFSSDRRVLLAIAVQQTVPPPPCAIDVDLLDRFLGAQAGLLRAVAPATRTCRQRVHDPALTQALIDFAPEAARARQALRLWAGDAPSLSPFGLHDTEPDALMLLEGDRFQVVDAEGVEICSGRLDDVHHTVHLREAVLLRVAGEDDAQAGQLPLLVLHLPGIRVAVPAPARVDEVSAPPPGLLHHTHAPEGAVLLAALQRLGHLPTTLREASPMQSPAPSDTPLGRPGEPPR